MELKIKLLNCISIPIACLLETIVGFDYIYIYIYIYIYCKSPNGVRYFKPSATNLLEDRLARSTLMLCDPNLKSVELRLIK